MQSSSAMSSLLVGLVSTKLVPLAAAIVMMLGANVGSTLVVQLLVLHLTDYALELVGVGALVAMLTHRTAFRRLGRVCLAFGLIVLGLAALTQGSQPIAASPLTATILRSLVGAPIVLMVIGAMLAIVLSSSTATIGLIITLSTTGTLPVAAALALMLGANVGTTLTALLTALQNGTLAGRRLALVHTGTKLLGALVVLALLDPLTNLLAHVWSNAGTEVAMTHLGFNLALAVFFVPLATPFARLMEALLPEPISIQERSGTHRLDLKALSQPAVALGQATRETLRMAEVVSDMLEHSMDAFEDGVANVDETIGVLDDQLDEMYSGIKCYLTQLDEAHMNEAQSRQELSLHYIITGLEAMGDVLTKQFLSLAQRKQSRELLFSDEEREDLLTYHQEIVEAIQQLLAALATHDTALAAAFLARKKELSQLKRDLHLQHIRRLHAKAPLSIASSSIHLDLLDAMSSVLSHGNAIAYAIQECHGTSDAWTLSGALEEAVEEKQSTFLPGLFNWPGETITPA